MARAGRERAEIAIRTRSTHRDFHCSGTSRCLDILRGLMACRSFMLSILCLSISLLLSVYIVHQIILDASKTVLGITCALYFISIRTSKELYFPPACKRKNPHETFIRVLICQILPITSTRPDESYCAFPPRFFFYFSSFFFNPYFSLSSLTFARVITSYVR